MLDDPLKIKRKINKLLKDSQEDGEKAELNYYLFSLCDVVKAGKESLKIYKKLYDSAKKDEYRGRIDKLEKQLNQ